MRKVVLVLLALSLGVSTGAFAAGKRTVPKTKKWVIVKREAPEFTKGRQAAMERRIRERDAKPAAQR